MGNGGGWWATGGGKWAGEVEGERGGGVEGEAEWEAEGWKGSSAPNPRWARTRVQSMGRGAYEGWRVVNARAWRGWEGSEWGAATKCWIAPEMPTAM